MRTVGNSKIRRYLYESKKWSDKTSVKHKHDYSQRGIIHLFNEDETRHIGHTYFLADMCTSCNSFKNAKFLDVHSGQFDTLLYNLPHRRFFKPHFGITLKDIQYIDDKVEIYK